MKAEIKDLFNLELGTDSMDVYLDKVKDEIGVDDELWKKQKTRRSKVVLLCTELGISFKQGQDPVSTNLQGR